MIFEPAFSNQYYFQGLLKEGNRSFFGGQKFKAWCKNYKGKQREKQSLTRAD